MKWVSYSHFFESEFMPAFPFRLSRALLGGALLVCSLPSLAAPAPSTLPRAATPVAVDPTRYVLGPDDVVSVAVMRHPEFSGEDMVIPGSGALLLPVIGTIHFAGRTISQVDTEVTNKLRVRLLHPEVSISLTKPRPRPIYIQGAQSVDKTGGILEYKNGWRITQALAAAGGLVGDPDLAAVSVTRGGKIVLDAALSPILNDPTGKSNLPLQVGDTLRFYQRVVNVSVSGAVARPGAYPLARGGGVVEAVGLAGGPIENASLSKATIRRASGAIIGVNLFKALRQNDPTQNITLSEGDIINVPATQDRVSVLGEVKTQGQFMLEDGRETRVSDALAHAGGTTENAALTRATISHANGTTQPVNLYQIISLGDKTSDTVLQAGDIINVPRARGITVTGEVNKGGIIPLEEGQQPRILDAIAAAGNLEPSLKPERAHITISRFVDGKAITLSVNAPALLTQTDMSQNSLVRDGDVITVSSIARIIVSIDGNIKSPGQFDIDTGDGVPELIARAGGATDEAALSRVSITRRGSLQPVVISYVDAIKKGGPKPDFQLQNGDAVVVPRNEARATVLAAVNRPGNYALPEDHPTTIGDLITMAGGTSFQAKTREVALLRKTPTGVQQFIYPMDRVDKSGILAVNVPIQSGDVLFVPPVKTSQSTLAKLSGIIGTLGSVNLAFR